jgi:DNA replication and repair protein RecF
VYVEELSLQNFRNLAPLSLRLSRGTVVVRGPNAQGKTNLLEALYVAATGRSFRHAPPRELIAHGCEQAEIAARIVREDVRHDVRAVLLPKSRRLELDGRNVRQATRLLELVNVVAFFPDDLRIAKGSPEERRRFLDRAIANHRPDFVTAALAYAQTVKSRNALLRQNTAVDRLQLSTYDDQLVQHGALVHACRLETLAALAPLAEKHFASIMASPEGAPRAEFSLTSGVPEGNGGYAERFVAALEASFARDRARGATSVGPHRADLVMTLEGHDARAVASQGQQRALILALKLAELEYLTNRLGSPPILLLDDVSSELDSERTRFLFEAIGRVAGQVWVSTTGAAPLPLSGEAQVFEVRQGRVGQAA